MEQIYITVSSKGQMVIPAAIREELGIEPGTRVAVRLEGQELILRPETLASEAAQDQRDAGVYRGVSPRHGGLTARRSAARGGSGELAKDGY